MNIQHHLKTSFTFCYCEYTQRIIIVKAILSDSETTARCTNTDLHCPLAGTYDEHVTTCCLNRNYVFRADFKR